MEGNAERKPQKEDGEIEDGEIQTDGGVDRVQVRQNNRYTHAVLRRCRLIRFCLVGIDC